MTSSLESFYIITFSKKFYLLFHFIDNGFLFMVCPFQQKIFYCTFTFNVLYKSDLFINQINHVFLKYIESSAIVLYKSYIPGQNEPLNIFIILRWKIILYIFNREQNYSKILSCYSTLDSLVSTLFWKFRVYPFLSLYPLQKLHQATKN